MTDKKKPPAIILNINRWYPASVTRAKELFTLGTPLEEKEVIFSRHDSDFLHILPLAPKVQIIASPTTGDPPAWRAGPPFPPEVKLCTLKGETVFLSGITATAEHTWGLIHAVHRRLPAANLSFGNRDDFLVPKMLSRSTLGVVGGAGRVGSRVVNVGTLLCRSVKIWDTAIDFNIRPESVRGVDILAICVGPHSAGCVVDGDVIDNLPDNAIIVNTSYSEALDFDYAIAALRHGYLWGLGTDVLPDALSNYVYMLSEEENPQNIIVTPHIAGSTEDARQETELFIIEKAHRMLLEGEEDEWQFNCNI